MTQRLGIPDQTGGRSGKPDGTLQFFVFCEGSLASYLLFSEPELSELLVGLQTCRWLLIPLRADGPKRRGPLGCLQGPVPGVLGRLELDGTRWRRF